MLPAAGLGGLLAAGLLGTMVLAPSQGEEAPQDQRFGLLTSLPIYRAPQGSVADALSAADRTQRRARRRFWPRLGPL